MNTRTTSQTVEVRADGEGLISHAGAYLLVELADRLGQVDRRGGTGSAPRRPRQGAGQGLGCRSPTQGADPRRRRLPAHRPLREGRGRRQLQGRLRLSPAALLPGRDRRAAGRPPSSRQRSRPHRRRSLRGLATRPRAVARARPSPRNPGPGRHWRRTHAFTQDCHDAGIRFSVGYEVEARVREAILDLPDSAWQSAIDGEGQEREGAQVTELSDHVDLSSWPEGTRLILRRERPHPGAQFRVFDTHGYRHTAFITDQVGTDIAALELCHRRRAQVEDAIRCAKETGMRSMPFAAFAHSQAWLEVSLAAQVLLRWGALLCLEGELALAEPKRMRQRLLHVAGRIVRSARRITLRLPHAWPWAETLAAAFVRLRALPAGAGP